MLLPSLFYTQKLERISDITARDRYNNRKVHWKYDIGDTIKDEKRDITILNKYIVYDKNDRIKHYNFKCNKCGWENGDIIEKIINIGVGCPVCCHNPQIVVEHINDIPTTAPWMIPYFQGGYDEAKLYTRCSEKRIYPICPDCGRIKAKSIMISNIHNNKSIGCICSDGISYPEKFMLEFFRQININHIYQLTSNDVCWITTKIRYDFAVLNNSCIVETHGIQHYEDKGFSTSYEEQKIIDIQKEQLAKESGIEHYIVLDCRKSELNWIKKSVLESELPTLFNFTEDDIDWLKCGEYALSNLVQKVCEYKNNNPSMSSVEISKIFKVSSKTINCYLKSGREIGWCNYDKTDELNLRRDKKIQNANMLFSKKVEIFKDNISLGIFESLHEIERKSQTLFGLKLSATKICAVCNGKKKQHKGYVFNYV